MGNYFQKGEPLVGAVTEAKNLFLNKGLEEVRSDPDAAGAVLKEAAKALKAKHSPFNQPLNIMSERPVERFGDIQELLNKIDDPNFEHRPDQLVARRLSAAEPNVPEAAFAPQGVVAGPTEYY